ncbi:hypothetical protein BS78_09G225900 [Paspalum vaginatum]|nr:hypothetical protein BS78_09G225900 [Paspalum vaginatum]
MESWERQRTQCLRVGPLLVILLLSTLPSCEPQPDADFRYTNCTPRPYQCGSLQLDIGYPFSVAGVDTPDYCSFPGYRLSCTDAGKLLISTNSTTTSRVFQITGVDYDDQLLTLVDQSLAEQSCLEPYRNTTIDGAMFAYTDRDQFLTVYVNCSAQSSSLPLVVDVFSCLSGGRSYYTTDNGTLAPPDVLGSCTSTLVLPCNSSVATSLAAGNSSLGVGDAIRGGFTVRWKAGAEWCGDCRNSGGFCGYNSSSPNDHTCFCPHGHAIGSCSSGFSRPKKKITAYILVSGAILVALLFVLCGLYHKKFHGMISCVRKSKHAPSIESFLQKHEAQHPKRYTYSEVKRMTRSFSEKLGKGGFGTVYKGNLPSGCPIAVKLLNNSKDDGQEFMNEVASIMRTSHVNVVNLLGYCLQG